MTLHDKVITLLINLAEGGSPSEQIAALAEARFWIADQRIQEERAKLTEYFLGRKPLPIKPGDLVTGVDLNVANASQKITVERFDGPPGSGPRTVIMGNWQDVPAAA